MAQRETVVLTNMCMIYDHEGNVLVQDRLDPNWPGVTFPGGHVEPGESFTGAVIREVREESGLEAVRPVSRDIYSLEILTVDGHEKRGRYVSSHLHLNLTYLLEADPAAPLRCKPGENSQVAWFGLEEAVAASSEPWFQKRVYSKLNEKLAGFPPRED